MEATATVSEKTSTPPCRELESQFEAAVVVTEISTAEVIDGVPNSKKDLSVDVGGAEVITNSAPSRSKDCSREGKVSTVNGSTIDVFFTIEDCMIEMKNPTGNGAEVKGSEVHSTIEDMKDSTGNGARVLTEVFTEVLIEATEVSSTKINDCTEELKDITANAAGVVAEVKARAVFSKIEDCMEELKDSTGNGTEAKATEVSSTLIDCMEDLKYSTGNDASVVPEIKATEVCMEESKDSAGNGSGVVAEVKKIEASATIEECMEDLKDSAGNGAGVLKATEVSSTIVDLKDSARNGAEVLKAIDIHSTMVVSNDDGINLVVELSIEKSDEINTNTPPTTESSWGDVPDENEPPVVAPTPRFVKRPRPPPENEAVDNVVQTMRNILMDLRNADDARLKPEDEEKVRSVLVHHPEADEKMGSGIDHIKIKRHSAFKEFRCFWVVRTDGSEIDFSYHKCLKQKIAKEHPDFIDRYDAIYRAPKRARQA